MMTYQPIGTNDVMDALCKQLERHGATRVDDGGDLVLLAAPDTMPENFIAAVPTSIWKRTIVVGLDREALEDRGAGTLHEFVEAMRPLGVISRESVETWGSPMFLGATILAPLIGAATLKSVATDTYAAWITTDADAGAFLIRLASVANARG